MAFPAPARVTQVRQLAVHPGPHLEEIFAIWLLRNFGNPRFPGVANAKLVFWPAGEGTPDGRPIGAHEAEGTLALGTALSRLDDHRQRAQRPGAITCSASLVAQALGVADDPALQDLLDYCARIDSRGGAGPFDLHNVVKLLNDPSLGAAPQDPRQVTHWTFRALNALYQSRRRLLQESQPEWASRAQVWEAPYLTGPLRIGEIHSDNRQIQSVGRHLGRCAVVIQHGTRAGSFGNSQIYVTQSIRLPHRVIEKLAQELGGATGAEATLRQIEQSLTTLHPKGLKALANSKRWPMEYRQIAEAILQSQRRPHVYWATMEIARVIRCEELYLLRMDFNPRDPRLWARQSLRELRQFYVLPEAGWIFNGAPTAPAVPASAIPTKPSDPKVPSPWVRLVYQALVPAWAEQAVPLRPGPAVPSLPTPATASTSPGAA